MKTVHVLYISFTARLYDRYIYRINYLGTFNRLDNCSYPAKKLKLKRINSMRNENAIPWNIISYVKFHISLLNVEKLLKIENRCLILTLYIDRNVVLKFRRHYIEFFIEQQS